VLPHGVPSARVQAQQPKEPYLCVYTSSWDRMSHQTRVSSRHNKPFVSPAAPGGAACTINMTSMPSQGTRESIPAPHSRPRPVGGGSCSEGVAMQWRLPVGCCAWYVAWDPYDAPSLLHTRTRRSILPPVASSRFGSQSAQTCVVPVASKGP
jgi:hypothetical protein